MRMVARPLAGQIVTVGRGDAWWLDLLERDMVDFGMAGGLMG